MTKWHAINFTFSFKFELHFCAENDFNGFSVNIRYGAPNYTLIIAHTMNPAKNYKYETDFSKINTKI